MFLVENAGVEDPEKTDNALNSDCESGITTGYFITCKSCFILTSLRVDLIRSLQISGRLVNYP